MVLIKCVDVFKNVEPPVEVLFFLVRILVPYHENLPWEMWLKIDKHSEIKRRGVVQNKNNSLGASTFKPEREDIC